MSDLYSYKGPDGRFSKREKVLMVVVRDEASLFLRGSWLQPALLIGYSGSGSHSLVLVLMMKVVDDHKSARFFGAPKLRCCDKASLPF